VPGHNSVDICVKEHKITWKRCLYMYWWYQNSVW